MNAPAARFQAQDPGFAERCRASFARQKAMTLVTVEYKINILAPAEVYAEKDGRSVHCASMQQTLMMLAGRSDHPD